MIWLTWRQFRLQALVITGVVLILGALCAITGPNLADDYRTVEVGFLQLVSDQRLSRYLYLVGQALVYAAPAVIGAFWGAPLIARELEAGTHRLVWSQSISRTRWLATKLAVTGLAAIAFTGLLSLIVTWWSDPIYDTIDNGANSSMFNVPRLHPPAFGARGVVPIGYAAFAFALGVTVGLLVRRSVFAIAITLTVVIAAQVISPLLLRPHLVTPIKAEIVLTQDNLRGIQLRSFGAESRGVRSGGEGRRTGRLEAVGRVTQS